MAIWQISPPPWLEGGGCANELCNPSLSIMFPLSIRVDVAKTRTSEQNTHIVHLVHRTSAHCATKGVLLDAKTASALKPLK